MSQETNTARSGGLVSSQGIEMSFVWLAAGVLGMVFLFFTLLGTKPSEKSPTYEGDRQFAPQAPQENPANRPEVGATEAT